MEKFNQLDCRSVVAALAVGFAAGLLPYAGARRPRPLFESARLGGAVTLFKERER